MPYIQGKIPLVFFIYIGFVVFSARAQESDYEYLSPIEAIDPDIGDPMICFNNGAFRYVNTDHTVESKATQKRDHWNRLRRSSGDSNDAFGDAGIESFLLEMLELNRSFPLVKAERPSWTQIHKKAASWSRLKKDTSWSRLKKDASWSRL